MPGETFYTHEQSRKSTAAGTAALDEIKAQAALQLAQRKADAQAALLSKGKSGQLTPKTAKKAVAAAPSTKETDSSKQASAKKRRAPTSAPVSDDEGDADGDASDGGVAPYVRNIWCIL